MSIAAVIPSLPHRSAMLAEALASVARQARPPDEIHVSIDHGKQGAAPTRNQAARAADTDWLAFLDDDDLWHPHHLAVLEKASQGAEIVYSACVLDGVHHFDHNIDFNPDLLRDHNYIPVTVLISTEAFWECGGFDPDDDLEDWRLWLRLLDAGARFTYVPQPTWTYRFHGAQRTFGRA